MLTQSAVNATYGTAQVLAERGVRLSAIPRTPLSQIVTASLQRVALESVLPETGGSPPVFTDELMAGANEPDAVGHNTHDEYMREAVEVIGNSINFNNQLARNTVNPMTERVVSKLDEALNVFTTSAGLPIAIVAWEDRALWMNGYTVELFSRYQDTVQEGIQYIGPALGEFRSEYLSTGLSTFDAEIAAYIAQLQSPAYGLSLDQIWARTFGAGPFNTNDALSGDRWMIDAAIVVYLAAGYLQSNPPADANASVAVWDTMCNNLRAQAGRVVCRGLQKLERDRRLSMMIVSYPQSTMAGQQIIVDGPVFNRFIQEGGSPEVILGAFFTDRQMDYAQLMSDREGYLARWKTAQSTLLGSAEGERFRALMVALQSALTEEINALPDELMVASRATLHERLQQCLGSVRPNALESLWHTARHLICTVIFPHTDVENTLCEVDSQMQRHPELEPREAALNAAVESMAQWLSKLITVETVRI
jgi:hypothetical protein